MNIRKTIKHCTWSEHCLAQSLAHSLDGGGSWWWIVANLSITRLVINVARQRQGAGERGTGTGNDGRSRSRSYRDAVYSGIGAAYSAIHHALSIMPPLRSRHDSASTAQITFMLPRINDKLTPINLCPRAHIGSSAAASRVVSSRRYDGGDGSGSDRGPVSLRFRSSFP
jgi:hypothetical protein